MKNLTMEAVRDYIREPYAWPGGYPKVLIMGDGEVLCAKCARENYRVISSITRAFAWSDGWFAVDVEVYWEGEQLHCCNCTNVIESAYGEVEDD